MPIGQWTGGDDSWDSWDEDRVVSRNVSPEAFMEELCSNAGGYGRFFRTLMIYYVGWWVVVLAIPAVFFDHHKCEVRLPYVAWILHAATLLGVLAMAVLLELSMVQRLGLLKPDELFHIFTERRWQVPLLSTIFWRLDAYTDVVFIFIARDCGSSLWWASLATFVFGVVFGQLLFNTCFACSDCDHELPASFGFFVLDFKLVNAAVKHVLPFDPDQSNSPFPKAVTLRTTGHLVSMEKIVGDIAQVSIQILFLHNTTVPHTFVTFSVCIGIGNGLLSLGLVFRECLQDEWSNVQGQGLAGGALVASTQLTNMSDTVLEMSSGPSSASIGRGAEGGRSGQGRMPPSDPLDLL